VSDSDQQEKTQRRLIRHDHKKRPLRAWIVPLAIILVIIIFLPKLVALIEK
jgi:hypothetical protein